MNYERPRTGFEIFTLVWGVLTVIFASIYTIVYGVVFSIFLITSISGTDVPAENVIVLLLTFIFIIVTATAKYMAGVSLIRKDIRSAGEMIFLAVLYFLSALMWLIFIFIVSYVSSAITSSGWYELVSIFGSSDFSVIEMASTFYIMLYFIKMVWDIATGVFLIVRTTKSAPYGREWVDPSGVGSTEFIPQKTGTIRGLFGSFANQSIDLYDGYTYHVGRDSTCEIVINHTKVSRNHCAIQKKNNSYNYFVVDNSSNGTFYNNARLTPGVQYEIPSGSYLAIGDADNVLLLE